MAPAQENGAEGLPPQAAPAIARPENPPLESDAVVVLDGGDDEVPSMAAFLGADDPRGAKVTDWPG